MTERTTEVNFFGQRTSLKYSDEWFGYAVVSLRVVMGWILFYAGMTKLLDPTWTAQEFLYEAASRQIPFAFVWGALADHWLWIVNPMNRWGETLIGLCLLLGALVRFAAVMGIVMMTLYYFAHLPLEWGFIVDYHIVYIMLLFGLAAVGAGRLLGLDYYLENNVPVPRWWSRYLLG